jgi:hypothetical protein
LKVTLATVNDQHLLNTMSDVSIHSSGTLKEVDINAFIFGIPFVLISSRDLCCLNKELTFPLRAFSFSLLF